MSRLVGIDIRPNLIRFAVLRSSYRRVHLEALHEIDRGAHETLEDALRAGASHLLTSNDAFSVAVGGSTAFVHRLALPPAALKRVDEVVPFELEAQVPVDFEELVFDSRVLPRERGEAKVEVLAAAARVEQVQNSITSVETALGHEPERVGIGALPLGNLAAISPALRAEGDTAMLDLGDESSELLVLSAGTIVYARTLSIGVTGLPDTAPRLLGQIRQTLVSWAAMSDRPTERLVICGGGAEAPGLSDVLSSELELEVLELPALELEGMTAEHISVLPRFAMAIGSALGLRAGPRDLNLRQGVLSYQRGYGFLKDKVPLLAGLGSVLLVSFVFSAWAESKALAVENEALTEAMSTLSKQILQQETDDVEEVLDLLDSGGKIEKDPQPKIDGFDLCIQLAQLIPKEFEHDVDELDLQRGHVKLRGLVKTTEDAQKVEAKVKEQPCLKNVKITKISAAVKSDRQKYAMEFDVKCDEPKASSTDPDDADEEEEE